MFKVRSQILEMIYDKVAAGIVVANQVNAAASAIHRQVGQALKHLPSTTQGNVFHNGNVPWQRVISSNGIIPKR